MKNLVNLFFVLILPSILFAQTLENQPSQYLSTKRTITITGENKFQYTYESRLLVSDEEGKEHCYDITYEDAIRDVKKIEATLYTLQGKKIKSLDKKDIISSTISSYAVYNEHEEKSFRLSQSELPYIYTSKIVTESKSLFTLPDWKPRQELPVAISELEFIFETPASIDFHCEGIDSPKVFMDDAGILHWLWRVENLDERDSEFLSSPESRNLPFVVLRANKFEYGDVAGRLNSWQAFGTWYNQLIEKSRTLSEPHPGLAALNALPERERIRRIYRQLQDKCRYVQIYLGIEGWKPHPVDEVYKNQYGDCKDLSLYFIAMLEQVGITAYPVMILTRNQGWTLPDFPNNSFNHLVTCVPLAEDTLWIDCTNDFATIDDMPDWIEGVNALVVTPQGGVLLRTPLSAASDNRSEVNAFATLQDDRNLSIKGQITLTGNLAQDERMLYYDLTQAKREEAFARMFSGRASDVTVNSLGFKDFEDPEKPLTIEFAIVLKHFARRAGSRFIFSPQFISRVSFDGEKPDERTQSLIRYSRYEKSVDVSFKLPAGMTYDKPAQSDSVDSMHGRFAYSLDFANNTLRWKSDYRSNVRDLPLEAYSAYYDFMKDVEKMAGKKVVLVQE